MRLAIASIVCIASLLPTFILAQPVKEVTVKTDPVCKGPTNFVSIKKDINSQVFRDSYYNTSTVYVPEADELYLDSIDFASYCGVAYCNKEVEEIKPDVERRFVTHVDSPKGSDCVSPKESISTFKCKGGKGGEVVVNNEADGKASFVATNAVAYFGSWVKNGCVTAARKGNSASTTGKDFLIVDCSGKLETACSDTPPVHQ